MLTVVYYDMDLFETIIRYIWGVFLNGMLMVYIEREKKWQEVLLWVLCFGSWATWLLYFILWIVQNCRESRAERIRSKKLDDYFGVTEAVKKEKEKRKKEKKKNKKKGEERKD